MKTDTKTARLALFGNLLLFILKILVGLLYNSISIISDALNSFTDIISSLIVEISIKVSHQRPDKKHQFGHTRAQPIAGLIVAFFTIIVGYEVISNSITRMISGETMVKGIIPLILVVFVFIIKVTLYFITKKVLKTTRSTALKAIMIDHRNDVMISIAVFIGVFISNFGYTIFDPIVGIIVGLYIIKAGIDIARENIDFLMGTAPPEHIFRHIEEVSEDVNGVKGLNDIRAHMLGTLADVEVHIYVDKDMNIKTAHDIGKDVQRRLQKLPYIHRAQIHIDPFLGKFKKKRKFS